MRRLDPPLPLAMLCILLGSGACAPAHPVMLGGSTTPRDRVDLALGAAMRAPIGDLVPPETPRDAEEILSLVEPGGVAPVGWARWGLSRGWDAGLLVSSSVAQLGLLGERPLSPIIRVIFGIQPFGGYAWSPARRGTGGGEGWRVGAQAPLALALTGGGVIEVWLGLRVGFEHAEGSVGARDNRLPGNLSAFRAGGFLGVAIGLRRVHVMLELAADYEYWNGSLAGVPIERMGAALTPGMALRIRF